MSARPGPQEKVAQRPVGWWVKAADRALDAAFDEALAGTGVERRGWQLLAMLARSPRPREELHHAVAVFDDAGAVDRALADLTRRRWLVANDGVVRLTEEGRARQAELAVRVEGVRERVRSALPGQDYDTLVGLLDRLIEGLRPQP